jgi:hypothetical protein
LIKDCSSLLNLKGKFYTLPDSQKKDIILSLALQSNIDINDEIRNELITAFLNECPVYREFYENIKNLNSGLENIKLRYNSLV